MEFLCKRAAIIVFLLSGFLSAAGQDKKPFFSEKGFLLGAGYGVNAESLPEGKYVPLFFIARFSTDIIKPVKAMRGQRFMLFFEPQLNAVILKNSEGNLRAAEFGLNAGVQYLLPLLRNVSLYTLISTGPHYITVRTEHQAHGFIFSDNMGGGAYFFLGKGMALNAGMRIRHMSNANTRMPNHGINTVNGFLGISFIFR